jgi:hypothetical protein
MTGIEPACQLRGGFARSHTLPSTAPKHLRVCSDQLRKHHLVSHSGGHGCIPSVTADVSDASGGNEATYAARAAGILRANPELADLVAMLEAALPSTNMDGRKILDYDGADRIVDTRSLWIARCGGDTAAGIREFEKQQGSWLPRRQGFEDLWNRGREFVYGAVNPGHDGVGAQYGPFCLIIRPARVAGANSGVFPANTAERYGRDSGVPDSARALAEAGCWRFVGDIGIVEFGTEAAGLTPQEWPRLVCNDTRFLELITAGPIEFADVTEVRLSQARVRELNAWSVLDRAGRLTDTAQQHAVAGWRVVKSWARTTRPHIVLRIV